MPTIKERREGYRSSDAQRVQGALSVPDFATDDQKFSAARDLMRTVTGMDSQDGSIINKGKPLAADEFLGRMRKVVSDGLGTLETDASRTWNALPDDEEARYTHAAGQLDWWKRNVSAKGARAVDTFSTVDERELPEDATPEDRELVKRHKYASDYFKASSVSEGAAVDLAAPEPFTPEQAQRFTVLKDRIAKRRTIREYNAAMQAENVALQYTLIKDELSEPAREIAKAALRTNKMPQHMVEQFSRLPLVEQQYVSSLVYGAKHASTDGVMLTAGKQFMNTALDIPVKASRALFTDSVKRQFMTDGEFNRFAQTRALLMEAQADKLPEFGGFGSAVVGLASTLPYMGYASIPYAGIGLVAGSAADDFERRVAAEGGDVTSLEFRAAKIATATAYAMTERLQADKAFRLPSAMQKRQAFLGFWRSAYKVAQVGKDFAATTGAELGQEGMQAAMEDGFVAYGLDRNIAREAVQGGLQELKEAAGTMLLTSAVGSAGKAIRINASKRLSVEEMISSHLHRIQLREAYTAGDRKGITESRAAIGELFEKWYRAGSRDNAVAEFKRIGFHPDEAGRMADTFNIEYRTIMESDQFTPEQKRDIIGGDSDPRGLVLKLMPDAQIEEGEDGAFSFSRDMNGTRQTYSVQFDGGGKFDASTPEAAASVSQALKGRGVEITPEEWLATPEENRKALIDEHGLRKNGFFSPVAPGVTEGSLGVLAGTIHLDRAAHPATLFHEYFHGFARMLRDNGVMTDADVSKAVEEFGPAQAPGELFNEEAAADAFRDFATARSNPKPGSVLGHIWNALAALVNGISRSKNRKAASEKATTTREAMFEQVLRGNFTGIPVATIPTAATATTLKTPAKASFSQNQLATVASSTGNRYQFKAGDTVTGTRVNKAGERTKGRTGTVLDSGPDGYRVKWDNGTTSTHPESFFFQESAPPMRPTLTGDAGGVSFAPVTAKLAAEESAKVAAIKGAQGRFEATTPDGSMKVGGYWAAMDLGDIITSDRPGYDARLQGRNREGIASRIQINEIANNVQPSRLFESPETDGGAPLLTQSMNVLSGNGRVLALRQAERLGKLDDYDRWVRVMAQEMGLDVADMRRPVLVRIIDSTTDQAELTRISELSNRPRILARSPAETAEADAAAIIEGGLLALYAPDANGNIFAASNREFLGAFIRAVNDDAMIDSTGKPTDEAGDRVRRAMLAIIAGRGPDSRNVVRALVENSRAVGMGRIVDGVAKAAGELVNLADVKPEFSILDELAFALREFMQFKLDGAVNVEQWIGQADMLRPPRPAIIDKIIREMGNRSGSGIYAMLKDYTDRARALDTKTGDMFGAAPTSKEAVLDLAIKATAETGERLSVSAENVRITEPDAVGSSHGQYDSIIYAKDGSDVVGYIDLSEYDGTMQARMIEVEEEYRRKGIGTKLTQAAVDYAKARGVKFKLSNTTEDGTALRRSLKRAGIIRYSVTATQDRAYMAAAEAGDTATAQRMMDEAAKAAGYKTAGFHQTSKTAMEAIFREGFRLDKGRARLSDEQVPDGFFFKPFDNDIGVGAGDKKDQAQIPVYLKMDKTLGLIDRQAFMNILMFLPEYNRLEGERRSIDAKELAINDAMDKKLVEIAKSNDKEAYGKLLDEMSDQVDAWGAKMKDASTAMRRVITEWMKAKGYDSLEILRDTGSFGRTVSTMVVLDPTQIKSADPITRDDSGRIIPLSKRFNAESADIRYSVSASEAKEWNRSLNLYASGELDTSKPITVLDGTPVILQRCGADNLPITITKTALDHSMSGKTGDDHAVPLREMRKLQQVLDDPIAVFKSKSEPDALVIYTEILEGGRNTVVALHLDTRSGRHTVNAVRSIYGKPLGAVAEWMKDGLALYVHQKKISALFQSIGVQFPKEGPGRKGYLTEQEFNIPPSSGDVNTPPAPRNAMEATRGRYSHESNLIASAAARLIAGKDAPPEQYDRLAKALGVQATGAEIVTRAKAFTEGEVAAAAKKALASKDPTAAITGISKAVELEKFRRTATAGVKKGAALERRLSELGKKAEDAGLKAMLEQVRGENLQRLEVDTGADLTGTMLEVLPEVFAETPPSTGDTGAEPELINPLEFERVVTQEELDARDERLRNAVDMVKAWSASERAAREKRIAERAAKAAAGGQADEDADAEQLDDTGVMVIPKALLETARVNLTSAREFAHFIRLWIGQHAIDRSAGRITAQTVWKDPESVELYRKTVVQQLTDMADRLVDPIDRALPTIKTIIGDIVAGMSPTQIEGMSASALRLIQKNAIRQSQGKLTRELATNIVKLTKDGKAFDTMKEDIKRKVTAEVERVARKLAKIVFYTDRKTAAEIERLDAEIEAREQAYANVTEPVESDAQYHALFLERQMVERYGGLRYRMPADILKAKAEIEDWLTGEKQKLVDRNVQREQEADRLSKALTAGTERDPERHGRPERETFAQGMKDELIATVRQRLQNLVKFSTGTTRTEANEAVEFIALTMGRGSELYAATMDRYRKESDAILDDVSQGDLSAYVKHLEEPLPADVARAVASKEQGLAERMTYGQAIQLYASITQGSYTESVLTNGRQEHARILAGALSAADLRLVEKLRKLYAARRLELSEVVQEVTGTPVWSPDPLYMPVKMFLGAKGGFATEARAWSPLAKALTPRVKNRRDFDETFDIMSMLAMSNEHSARAIAFGTRGIRLRGVLGRRAVQNAIIRYHGREQLSRLLEQVNDHLIGTEPQRDAGSKMIKMAMQLTTFTALSGNLLSAMKQLGSIPAWGLVLKGGLGEVAGHVRNFDRATAAELADSDGFRARYGGGMMREISEIIADGRGNVLKRVYMAGMQPLQGADMVASLLVGTGLYKTRRDALVRQGMDLMDASAQAKTETFNLIEECQQSSRPENMPRAMRRDGIAWRLLMQFASSPMLQLSHEMQAARDWRATVDPDGTMNLAQVIAKSASNAAQGIDDGRAKLVRSILINHALTPVIMQSMSSLFNAILGDDEEPEEFAAELAVQMFAGPLSRVVFFGAALETMARRVIGAPYRVPRTVPAESALRLIDRGFVTATDILTLDFEKAQEDLVKMVESTGAPQRQIIKAVRNYSE
jgi:GNAT superfamily N-acetyltransferase